MSFFFPFSFLLQNQRAEQVLPWDWYWWEWGRYGEMVKEGQYGANAEYTCI
jgi:hypothetical protein